MKQLKLKKISVAFVVALASTASIAQTVLSDSQLMADCQRTQQNRITENAAVYGTTINQDRAVMQIGQKPVQTGGQFSCYGQTAALFNSMLSSITGLFGEWGQLASLFNTSAATGDAARSLCGSVRQAIAGTIGFSCPSTGIPYLRVGCSGGINLNENGVNVYGTGITGQGGGTISGNVGPTGGGGTVSQTPITGGPRTTTPIQVPSPTTCLYNPSAPGCSQQP